MNTFNYITSKIRECPLCGKTVATTQICPACGGDVVAAELVDYADVEVATKAAIKTAQAIFRSKGGWKYKFRKQSASGDWSWTKDGRTITLNGWHGREPDRWGYGCMLFSLYDSAKEGFKPVPIFIQSENPDEFGAGMPEMREEDAITLDEFAKYEHQLVDMLEYIDKS